MNFPIISVELELVADIVVVAGVIERQRRERIDRLMRMIGISVCATVDCRAARHTTSSHVNVIQRQKLLICLCFGCALCACADDGRSVKTTALENATAWNVETIIIQKPILRIHCHNTTWCDRFDETAAHMEFTRCADGQPTPFVF